MYPRQFLISTLYFISRQQITNPKYIISYPEVHHQHGLISTGIGLNMRINSQYFEDGVLRIKCVASISPIIWSGNKETVIQQQGLQQFEIPLPSIDTREVLFLGELCVAVQHFNLNFAMRLVSASSERNGSPLQVEACGSFVFVSIRKVMNFYGGGCGTKKNIHGNFQNE